MNPPSPTIPIQDVAGLFIMVIFFLVLIFAAQSFFVKAYRSHKRKKRLKRFKTAWEQSEAKRVQGGESGGIKILTWDNDGVPTLVVNEDDAIEIF